MRPAPGAHARPSLLKRLNERTILLTLQSHGPCSRADLSRLTGISGPTVTRAVSSLLEARLLEETDPLQGSLGRPGRVLRLGRTGVAVIGLVFGKSQCEIGLAGLDGQSEEANVRTFPTPDSYAELIDQSASLIQELARQREVLSVGVSLPGLYDGREGRSLISPNVPITNGQQPGLDLSSRLPADVDVSVMQECDALCLAERMYGLARGVSDFAMLDITEGLGLGVVQGGELLDGHSGLAGELGHITVERQGRRCGCGNSGCLETVATDTSLLRDVQERTGRNWSMSELLSAVQAGEIEIEAELSRLCDYLAIGMAAVINIFNPHRLFVFGRFFDLRANLFDETLHRTRERALGPSFADCHIIRARGNKRLGAIAAAIQPLTHGRD